jgi:hypothetical protein
MASVPFLYLRRFALFAIRLQGFVAVRIAQNFIKAIVTTASMSPGGGFVL